MRILKGMMYCVGLFLLAEIALRVFLPIPKRDELVYKSRDCQLSTAENGSHFGCTGPQSMRSVQVTNDVSGSTGDQVTAQGQVLLIPPPGNRPRIIFLGGSSVCEPSNGNFPTQIARTRRDWEVLNLCKSGMGIDSVSALAQQAEILNPSLVVVYAGHNQYNKTIMASELIEYTWTQRALVALLTSSHLYRNLFKLWWKSNLADGDRVVFRPVKGQPNALQITNDSSAMNARENINIRFARSFQKMLDRSSVPMLVTTVLHNSDVSPQGVLTTSQECANATRNMRSKPFITQLQIFQQSCGDEHAMADWLKMKIAIQSGRTEQAKEHWRNSLRRDPLPLRAPLKVNEMILEIAAEHSTPAVDLYQRFGPFPSGVLFTDTLHFSQAGVEQVAATLIPEIEKALKSQ